MADRVSTIANYLAPKTVKEACSYLSKFQGKARIIAGGTDLMVSIKNKAEEPACIIDLKTIPELNYIHHDKKGLTIGVMATIHDVENSPIVSEKFGVLADAARQTGSPQVRYMATVIGNICRAAPSADMAPALIALDASVRIISTGGERMIKLEKFFVGPGKSILRADEICSEIQVPDLPPNTSGVYLKMTAGPSVGIALVGAAVILTFDSKRTTVADARIVLGAVAPTPLRAVKAENMLKGNVPDDKLIEKAARAAAAEAKPISDIRSSAEYRKEIVKVLVSRALRQLTNLPDGI